MPSLCRRICLVLVFGHLAIACARIPTDVIGKRRERIADYHARGAVRFHLDTKTMQGAAAVETLLRHSPPDAVVLHRGAYSGALEFAPPLLWPRLLYAESWADGDDSSRAQRLARVPFDGRDRIAVLVCDPEQRGQVQGLHLEAR